MLSKLNKIASMVADAISSHPPEKKKAPKKLEKPDDGMEHEELDSAVLAEQSINKAMKMEKNKK